MLEIDEPLLGAAHEAKILGISQCTLRNRVLRKKVGGRVMFLPDTVPKLIAYDTSLALVWRNSESGLNPLYQAAG